MARSQAGAALTDQHRGRQLALRAMTLRDFQRLWPMWEIADPASFDRLVAASVPLVQSRHRDAATVAGRYYEAFRLAEGATGNPTLRLADQIDSDRIVRSLYVTGQVQARKALAGGLGVEEVRRAALVRTSGAVSRHVANGARETITGSVAADPQARGWQRVGAANPCAFCSMLISRGPVYKEQSVDFQAHDHCACHSAPVYPGGEWTPQSRQLQESWQEHASGEDDPLNVFRRALEGRA